MPKRPKCCQTLEQWLAPETFKALAEPSRAALLIHMAGGDGPHTVGSLAAHLPIDVSVVSRHLRVLREVGVVRAEKHGKEVRLHLDCGDLIRMLRNLADALESCCPPDGCSVKETS